ncbi:S49 family peptidase [Marinicellulosiphila megalodicopiae]|uniref:S49 family peptidase n=1 Tax=Marinicellulosiphila megalodicopiae TaxID=2724896 RepID=UPI003BB01229
MLAGQTALLDPQFLPALISSMQDTQMLSIDRPEDMEPSAAFWLDESFQNGETPYQVIDGVAVIDVSGVLVSKLGIWGDWYGYRGYDGIIAEVKMAVSDQQVKKILINFDTGGGAVNGCFEACETLAELSKQKEITAFAFSSAYSAGYALACSCTKLVLTQTSGVGSIGVITAHWNYKEHLKQYGMDVTLIYAGETKADGNPYDKLPDDVKSRMQAGIDSLRVEFATHVATQRSLTIDDVLATEAACFRGVEAVENGLADAVMHPDKVLESLTSTTATGGGVFMGDIAQNPTSSEVNKNENDNMKKVVLAVAPTAEDAAALTQAGIEFTVSASTDKSAERTRINGILSCEAAEGRSTLANHLAMNTDMSVEDATALLEVSAKEAAKVEPVEAATPADPLGTAMGIMGGANVEAESQSETQVDEDDVLAQQMASYSRSNPLVKPK